MKTKPLFLVLSAPTGCGKSTLIDMILQEYCDIVYSISCTTRAPRGEEDGLDYHFKTKERLDGRGPGTNDTVKRYSRGGLVMVGPTVRRLRVRLQGG